MRVKAAALHFSRGLKQLPPMQNRQHKPSENYDKIPRICNSFLILMATSTSLF